MIILKEKQQPLVEMARFRGFGITIEVRSDDHGKLGNTSNPAHAHVLDNSGKEVAQIALIKEAPKKASDIIWHRTPNPPAGLGDRIVKLANSKSITAKESGMSGTVWQGALYLWLLFHGGKN